MNDQIDCAICFDRVENEVGELSCVSGEVSNFHIFLLLLQVNLLYIEPCFLL